MCLFSLLCVNQYLIDTYTLLAASALGAATIVRGVFGLAVPLVAPEILAGLGLDLGNDCPGYWRWCDWVPWNVHNVLLGPQGAGEESVCEQINAIG